LLYDKDHELQLDSNYNIPQYAEESVDAVVESEVEAEQKDEQPQQQQQEEPVKEVKENESESKNVDINDVVVGEDEQEQKSQSTLGQSGRRFLTEATKLIPVVVEPEDELVLQQQQQQQQQTEVALSESSQGETESKKEAGEGEVGYRREIATVDEGLKGEVSEDRSRRSDKEAEEEDQEGKEQPPSRETVDEFEQMVAEMKSEIEADEESGYSLLEVKIDLHYETR